MKIDALWAELFRFLFGLSGKFSDSWGTRFWDLTTPLSRSICGHPSRIWSLTHKNKVFLHWKIDQRKYYLDLQHHIKSVKMRFVQKRAWPLMNLYHKTNILKSLVDEGKRTRNVKILISRVLLSIPTWVLNVTNGINHFCPRRHTLLYTAPYTCVYTNYTFTE